jgi:hypothetical protein
VPIERNLIDVDTGAQYDDGGHALPPVLRGAADHGNVYNVGVFYEDFLDLARIDIDSTGDDHVDGDTRVAVEAAGARFTVTRRLGKW